MRIIFRNIDFYVPPHFKDGEKYYIDYDGDFAINRDKISEVKIKHIEVDPKINIKLDKTLKNDYFFSRRQEYEVDIWIGHQVYKLHKITALEKSEYYEVEISMADDHWLKIMEDTFLKDVDYGDFEYSIFEMVRSTYNKDTYTDADDNGYYVPTVDYGNLTNAESVNYLTQRPFISPLRLIKKALCANGWRFRCPFLESDLGRTIWTYDWADGFLNNEELNKTKEFKAQTLNNSANYNPGTLQAVIFENETFDNSSLFDGEYYIGDSEIVTFHLEGYIDIQHHNNCSMSVVIFRDNGNSGSGTYLFDDIIVHNIIVNESGQFKINIETEEIIIDPNYRYYVYINPAAQTDAEIIGMNLTFYSKVVGINVKDGDTLDYKKTIDQELTIKKYVEGIAHLMSGMFHEDINKREVWLYTPFDTYVGDNSTQPINGFYISDPKQLEDVQCNSEIKKFQTDDVNRFEVYRFKQGADVFIEMQKYGDNKQPYSKIIDKINGKKEYDYNDNPLFEATLNNDYHFISRDASLNMGEYPIRLPAMWDNEEGNISKQIGHRILIGCFTIQKKSWTSLILNHMSGGSGGGLTRFPMGYQMLDYDIIDTRRDNLKLIYGDGGQYISLLYPNHKITLWTQFIKDEYYLKSSFVSILKFEYDHNVISEDFRKFWKYNLFGAPVILILDKINNHIVENGISTPYEFNLLADKSQICIDSDDELEYRDTCSNFPILTTTKNGNCYDIEIGGTYESSILGNVFFQKSEKQTDGSWGSWSTITNLTSTTAELCTSTTTKIKATISWSDGCGSTILINIINPCGENNPQLEYTLWLNEDNEYCISVTIGGTIVSSYTIDTFTYLLDGGPTTNYTEGATVFPINNQIVFDLIIDWDDTCKNSELQLIITVPPIAVDCDSTDADVECEITDDDCFTFNRTGSIAFEFVTDVIEFQCSDDGITYGEIQRWDGEEICCQFIKGRRIINFCDDKCPMYCTDWVECSIECDPFIIGTPPYITICNET